MALKDIKAKIGATNRTHKVTRAMEAVSAVKMRKTQASALADRSYARAAASILARLSGSGDLTRHPLASVREVRKTALVVISSDKGLAGALNSSVIKAAEGVIAGKTPGSVVIYAYGRKGEEHFRRRGYTIAKAVENKRDDVELSVMEELAGELSSGFVTGDYDEVIAVYNNFKSTFEQMATSARLLPLSLPTITRIVEEILPVKGRFSELRKIESPAAYTIEGGAAEVLNVLVPRLVAVTLYHMLLESKASEHSARMVAMKSASDKSEEVAHDLTRLYNKRRQAAITREVSEIVGGREALAA